MSGMAGGVADRTPPWQASVAQQSRRLISVDVLECVCGTRYTRLGRMTDETFYRVGRLFVSGEVSNAKHVN
jgi:hypothetical protein|eukprot:1463905-Prymnesium_polylepis.1